MIRRAPLPFAVALSLVLASVALAGGEGGEPKKADPKKAGSPEPSKAPAYTGPEIAWVRSYAEAREEAAERNVAIYLHSHGST